MKRFLIIFSILAFGITAFLLINSPSAEETADATTPEMETTNQPTYQKISPEDAKSILDSSEPYILLDVRSQEEYDQAHITTATLLPHDEIATRAETDLPDKSTPILVYCYSGGRSAIAAETLTSLGYSHVYDLGGILDWPYETETADL